MEQVIIPGGLAWAIVAATAAAFFGGIASYWRMTNEFSAIKTWMANTDKRIDERKTVVEKEFGRIDKHQEKQDEHIDNLWNHVRGTA